MSTPATPPPSHIVVVSGFKKKIALKDVLATIQTGSVFAIHRSFQPGRGFAVFVAFIKTEAATGWAQAAAGLFGHYKTYDPAAMQHVEVSTGGWGDLGLPADIEGSVDGHGLSRSVIIWKPKASSSKAVASKTLEAPPEVQECTRQLHLWRNGFSLNDGSPLSYDDPENKKILDKIFNGQTPHGFFGVQPGERVEVELRPHPDDDYRAPEEQAERIPGLISTHEVEYAKTFGIENADPSLIVQVTILQPPQILDYTALLVEYTSVLSAARAVDTLLHSQQTSRHLSKRMYEFVADNLPLRFRGPHPLAPLPGPFGAPPQPPHLQGQKMEKDAEKPLRRWWFLPFWWEIYETAISQQKAAKALEPSRVAAGLKWQRADWVCSQERCGGYNWKQPCYHCKVERFRHVFERNWVDMDDEGRLEELRIEAERRREFEVGRTPLDVGSVLFLGRPGGVQVGMGKKEVEMAFLPLCGLFGVGGDGDQD